MIYYPNQNTNTFTRAIGLASEVRTASFKARDTLVLDVVFHDGSAPVDLEDGSELVFIVKTSVAAAAPTLALADVWEKVAAGHYRSTLNLNTVPLATAIADLPKILAVGELSWSPDGDNWESSNTLVVTIYNDVYKGHEGTPQELPDPAGWMPSAIALLAPPVFPVLGHVSLNLGSIDVANADSIVRFRLTDHAGTHDVDVEFPEGSGFEGEDNAISVAGEMMGNSYIAANYDVSAAFESVRVRQKIALTDGALDLSALLVSGAIETLPLADTVLAAGVTGTTAGALGQLGIFTSGTGLQYTFRCTSLAPFNWEGATPGLLHDPNPVTGIPRWKILRFVGAGDDRTTEYQDLT